MALPLILGCIAVQLLTGLLAAGASRAAAARPAVYGATFVACTAIFVLALETLASNASALVLPFGVPWVGAHFRLDALAAFFLVVVSLGGMAASVYGIGYGRQEVSPQRILPVFPAFLAAMSMVVLADDAFVFLFSWELMSLASWALVMAHHRTKENAHAGFVYLVMAGFGTLSLLLCFGLLAGPNGGYAFTDIRAAGTTRHDRRAGAGPGPPRRWIEGRSGAAACVAAARPSGGAEPRLGADERGDDQGRHLWPDSHRLRPARVRRHGGGARWSWCWAARQRCWACSMR